MPDIGPWEIILVLAIALLVLGPSKLPEIGKSLGSSIREFRKAATDVQESVRLDAPPKPAAQVPPPAPAPSPAAPMAETAQPDAAPGGASEPPAGA